MPVNEQDRLRVTENVHAGITLEKAVALISESSNVVKFYMLFT